MSVGDYLSVIILFNFSWTSPSLRIRKYDSVLKDERLAPSLLFQFNLPRNDISNHNKNSKQTRKQLKEAKTTYVMSAFNCPQSQRAVIRAREERVLW